MRTIHYLILVLSFSSLSWSQSPTTTAVNTKNGTVDIPGKWTEFHTEASSGQTYLKNDEGVIIAVAYNLKKAYPCYKSGVSDFENVQLFHQWDSDYYKENKYDTALLKVNEAKISIIWKFNDKRRDNVFLFGSKENCFLNLMVYTDLWEESKKISFLEEWYALNTK
ncbi:hypothetical protein [Flavobacterium sp. N1719]|uniref:hypothetical protein n=1 Tax=Flavobacterium sp. N1719 TaxID=2885633 RepID=UPI0022230C01|nr:hypothetical protein [Flavobacterium sp. N1719]